MPHANAPTEIPLERYRAVMGSLATERDFFDDQFWLRFAAQAAVLCPGEPDSVANRIRTVASTLKHHAKWYQDLAAPVRFIVAALLVQHHISVDEFLAEHPRISGLLHQAGLRHGGFCETMAIIIMRLSIHDRPINLQDAKRIKAIYDQMKSYHWWLTGPDDLPSCAALAQCSGSPDVVVSCAENAYRQLHGAGLGSGNHLQTATNILPLAGISIDGAVSRFLSLRLNLEDATGTPIQPQDYDAISVLTLLDHQPKHIVENLIAVRKELDLFQPELQGTANLFIATDLCFLDLVRFDRDLAPLTGERHSEALKRAIHAFHIASAVMVSHAQPQALTDPLYPALGWPYIASPV